LEGVFVTSRVAVQGSRHDDVILLPQTPKGVACGGASDGFQEGWDASRQLAYTGRQLRRGAPTL
jgi:hypothetical protein